MSRCPPIRIIVAIAALLGAAACGTTVPSPPIAATPAGPAPVAIGTAARGDLDGLVVLTGGRLSIATPAGFVGLAGPAGAVDGMSAANGRLIVRTAGPAFAIADVPKTVALTPAWLPANVPSAKIPAGLSGPALSPSGDLVAMAGGDPAIANARQLVVVNIATGEVAKTALDQEVNGPPVWLDDKTVLVEVLPEPGGSRFLQVALATGRIAPVAADGYGPAVSADGSMIAIASTDGSVLAVPSAAWLRGDPPDEGAVVDASGTPFQLAVDAAGQRIAIGYGDAGGDPVTIAAFVREGWRVAAKCDTRDRRAGHADAARLAQLMRAGGGCRRKLRPGQPAGRRRSRPGPLRAASRP